MVHHIEVQVIPPCKRLDQLTSIGKDKTLYPFIFTYDNLMTITVQKLANKG